MPASADRSCDTVAVPALDRLNSSGPRQMALSGDRITLARDLRRSTLYFALFPAIAALVRLGLEPHYWGWSYLVLLLSIPGYVLVQHQVLSQPTDRRIRHALFGNFLAVCLGYALIGAALDAPGGWRADDTLLLIEKGIFGRDPQDYLAAWRTPWLSTLTMLGYVSFVGILIYLFFAEGVRLSRATGKLQLRFMLLYGLGYSGYLLLPAAGPVFRKASPLGPIVQSRVSAYLNDWVIRSCSGVDVWPSLHAAVCCFALLWTFRRHRRVFYALVLPGGALLLGAVYFRFHYFVDILAGSLLAVLCLLPGSQID